MKNPLAFDPVAVGSSECAAWAAYYRHEWLRFLTAAVGMIRQGFGMGPGRTVAGAWRVLRANQFWAPYPDNDPAAARAQMRRFYRSVTNSVLPGIEPARAAELEVRWWAVHRARQYNPAIPAADLEQALVDLYAYVYRADPVAVRPAARYRVEAMDLSDEWVRAGKDLDSEVLVRERRALIASYSALRDAYDRGRLSRTNRRVTDEAVAAEETV